MRAQAFDDGNDAAQFLGERHGAGAGAGGFAADVENVGAFSGEPQAVGDGARGGVVLAAIREAVGRDIDDAHDTGAIKRQTGEARARLRETLDEAAQFERIGPVALEQLVQVEQAALCGVAGAVRDFDDREIEARV